MIITVLVNGVKQNHNLDSNIPIYKAITKIRSDIKKEYKKRKEMCELWFTDIKI